MRVRLDQVNRFAGLPRHRQANPSEPDTIALITKIAEIDRRTTIIDCDAKSAKMLGVARTLLKREWVRLKD